MIETSLGLPSRNISFDGGLPSHNYQDRPSRIIAYIDRYIAKGIIPHTARRSFAYSTIIKFSVDTGKGTRMPHVTQYGIY